MTLTQFEPGVDFHRVKIRNGDDRLPFGCASTVEIDGKPDRSVTHIAVDMSVDGLTQVTLTMFAEVDIDVPAQVTRVEHLSRGNSSAGRASRSTRTSGSAAGRTDVQPDEASRRRR